MYISQDAQSYVIHSHKTKTCFDFVYHYTKHALQLYCLLVEQSACIVD